MNNANKALLQEMRKKQKNNIGKNLNIAQLASIVDNTNRGTHLKQIILKDAKAMTNLLNSVIQKTENKHILFKAIGKDKLMEHILANTKLKEKAFAKAKNAREVRENRESGEAKRRQNKREENAARENRMIKEYMKGGMNEQEATYRVRGW